MNRNSIILCLLTFLYSCSTPDKDQIAQDKVKDYLRNTQQMETYKSILFGKLDSAYTTVKETSLYKIYDSKRSTFMVMEILSKNHPDMYSEDEVKSNKEQEIYFQAICDSLESIFVPEFTGWKIQHIYQYKNKKDESIVDNFTFYLDNELQRIIKEEQIYRNLPLKTYNQDPIFYGIK